MPEKARSDQDNRTTGKRRRNLRAVKIGYTVFGVCLALIFGLYLSLNRPPDIVIPTHTVPANNAYDDFVQAGSLAGAMAHPNVYSRPTPVPSLAYMALSAQDAVPALALLHSALNKPYMTPAMRTANDPSFRSFAKMRELARTAAGTARYYEQIGQPARATDTLLDGYEMGVIMPKGGNLIVGLVAVAVQSICVRDLDDLVSKLSPADLERVARRLDIIAGKTVPFHDILDEEANTNAALYLEFLRSPASHGLSGLNALTGDTSVSRLQQIVDGIRYAAADKRAMLKENLGYMHAIAKESQSPYTGPFLTPVPNNMVASEIMPVYVGSRPNFVGSETVLALLRVETALYRYRAATGHFPSSITMLTSEKASEGRAYLAEIPADPFGGKPLHYSVQPDHSFQLYSLGVNLRDDHGTPQLNPNDRKGGDIVAGKMWPPRKPLPFATPAGSTGSSAPPAK